MSKNVEIALKDWQTLIDLHEKFAPILLEAVDMLQAVSYTSTVPGMAADAAKLFGQLAPLSKLLFVEEPPFGIEKQK